MDYHKLHLKPFWQDLGFYIDQIQKDALDVDLADSEVKVLNIQLDDAATLTMPKTVLAGTTQTLNYTKNRAQPVSEYASYALKNGTYIDLKIDNEDVFALYEAFITFVQGGEIAEEDAFMDVVDGNGISHTVSLSSIEFTYSVV